MNPKDCEINVGTSLRNTSIILDNDDPYKYKDDPTIITSPLVPKGGYTNEVLYKKIYFMES